MSRSNLTTRAKSLKWPSKESTKESAAEDAHLFDEKKRIIQVDPGRFMLFGGRWLFPAVTVRPTIEHWSPLSVSLVKPKRYLLEPNPIKKKLLYRSIGLDGLAAYQALKSFRERAPDFAPPPIELAAPVPAPANITTKQKLKEFLGTSRNVPAQPLSLEDFLTCLDLGDCLDKVEGKSLRDLKTSSEEELTGLGIEVEDVVQMKNGINYLMDLHNKSFAFAFAFAFA